MENHTSKKTIISNAKIAIFAQLITLMIGFFKSLIIPSLLTVTDFGYWQIYLLYLPYIGLFYWGFNDGIYLKYGGYDEKDLPYEKIRASTKCFFLLLIFESIILSLLLPFISTKNETKILLYVVLNISIQGIYGMMIYILQITNRIKKYSFFSIIDKIIFVLYLIAFALSENRDYMSLIRADILSRLIVTIFMIIQNKELFFGKQASIKEGFFEFKNNIEVGISLMLASFISMLFTGAGKIFIANSSDITNYAYYSFGMSLINLLLVCFSSISTVIYPVLKKMNENSYGRQYNTLNKYYEIICTCGMFAYFICYFLINNFYIQYIPVLKYLNLLFILAIFQGKITLLNNTFYKVLRQERKMLFDNLISITIFCILCYLFCDNVYKIALITCLVMGHRSLDTEIHFRREMNNLKNNKFISLFTLIIIFLISTEINIYFGLLLYSVYFIIYIYTNRNAFLNLIKLILNKN